jgi:hypothetical protein
MCSRYFNIAQTTIVVAQTIIARMPTRSTGRIATISCLTLWGRMNSISLNKIVTFWQKFFEIIRDCSDTSLSYNISISIHHCWARRCSIVKIGHFAVPTGCSNHRDSTSTNLFEYIHQYRWTLSVLPGANPADIQYFSRFSKFINILRDLFGIVGHWLIDQQLENINLWKTLPS